MQIKESAVIISGGASGMGAATARFLTEKGAQVALLDQNFSAAKNLADDIGALAIECDVTQDEAVTNAINQAREQHGPARICICCAGVAPAGRIVGRKGAMPLEAFSKVININLIGTFNVMRVAAENMIPLDPVGESDERGVIINTASIAAYEGQIGQSAYSASKGGIVSLTLPAAREFAQFGIRVNAIAPGLIATPLLSNMPQDVQDSLAATVPFPKRLGKPSEFASLVSHIIDNPMINGSVLRLDGALRMEPK